MFTEHANKLVEVANLACSMSANEDGVKMVRYAAQQIQNLCPQVDLEEKKYLGLATNTSQVINAARVLASRPRSKVAQDNMDVFRNAWENQVRSHWSILCMLSSHWSILGPDPDRGRGRHRDRGRLPRRQREPHPRGCQQVLPRPAGGGLRDSRQVGQHSTLFEKIFLKFLKY